MKSMKALITLSLLIMEQNIYASNPFERANNSLYDNTVGPIETVAKTVSGTVSSLAICTGIGIGAVNLFAATKNIKNKEIIIAGVCSSIYASWVIINENKIATERVNNINEERKRAGLLFSYTPSDYYKYGPGAKNS